MHQAEAGDTFDCFGGSCSVVAGGAGRDGSAEEAVALARRALLDWHARFSRFLPGSELCSLNRDPRTEVPVSPLMARLAGAVVAAGSMTHGLVDATLLRQLESAGYVADLAQPVPLDVALALAPARTPAAASAETRWALVEVDKAPPRVRRPAGVGLDSGGLAKGLFADVLAHRLAGHASFAVDCGGDIAIGGTAGLTRAIRVQSPFHGGILHTFELQRTGVATSGIGRRSWLDASGAPCHHLLDPSSGRPAFTGVVQATALAPSALLAEIRAKAAVLSGPADAAAWLPDGGVVVLDNGSHIVLEPPPVISLDELTRFAVR